MQQCKDNHKCRPRSNHSALAGLVSGQNNYFIRDRHLANSSALCTDNKTTRTWSKVTHHSSSHIFSSDPGILMAFSSLQCAEPEIINKQFMPQMHSIITYKYINHLTAWLSSASIFPKKNLLDNNNNNPSSTSSSWLLVFVMSRFGLLLAA